MLYRIETFQFDARIRCAELPVDGTDALIAMLLPTLDLLAKLLNCGNVVGQTLPRQHTQFDLGNIEPARMLRGIVDLQTVDQGFGLLRRKHFIKRSRRMRIQIVHHQNDFLRLRIVFFQHLLHEACPVLLCPVFGHFQVAFASQRLIGNEEVGTSLFLIGVVFPRDLSGFGRLGGILV